MNGKRNRLLSLHTMISLAIAVAVPLTIWFVNGAFEPWMLVLGVVIGFSYWYFRVPLF